MMIWERRSYHFVSCNRISPFWTRNVWLTDSSGDGEAFLRCNTLRSPPETNVACENRPSQKKIHLPTIGGHFLKMLDLQGSPPYLKAQFRSRGSLRRAHRFYLMMASSAALWCHWECILNIRVCQQKKFNWIFWYQLVSFHFWYHLITSTSHSIPKAWLTCSMGFLPFDQKTWEMAWRVFNQVSRHHAMSSCPKTVNNIYCGVPQFNSYIHL